MSKVCVPIQVKFNKANFQLAILEIELLRIRYRAHTNTKCVRALYYTLLAASIIKEL